MKTILQITFLFVSFLSIGQTEELISKKPLNIGETITFSSEVLQEDRTINVYLPFGYSADSTKSYPVIYLLDGTLDEDFIHISGLVQFGSYPWINMLPETIVVGIANIDRKKDLTYPTNVAEDKKTFPTTGGSENFMNFIETELKPLINATYATNDTTTIIGQSLGGLFAAEVLLKRPEMFDNFIIVSPSIWWDTMSLLKITELSKIKNKSIHISVGEEGRIMKKTAKQLYKKVKNLDHSNEVFFKFLKEQDHGDALHLSVYDAFEKMFN